MADFDKFLDTVLNSGAYTTDTESLPTGDLQATLEEILDSSGLDPDDNGWVRPVAPVAKVPTGRFTDDGTEIRAVRMAPVWASLHAVPRDLADGILTLMGLSTNPERVRRLEAIKAQMEG